jgi:RNA polymerase sigma factor (sigma-70 family)
MNQMRTTGAPADIAPWLATMWRAESARVLGALVRFVGDVDTAEDLAQEALLRALSHWPAHGVPERPGAWLTTTAKRIAIDRARHRQMADSHHADLSFDTPAIDDEAVDVEVNDDVLRMMFVACHPVLPRESRVALTLRWVAGLSTAEVARAFLSNETAVAQRLVRARRTLSEARVPFVVPNVVERRARLGSLLEVLYLVFNEGYAARAGDDRLRPALCDEALRLARRLASLLDGDRTDAGNNGQRHVDGEDDVDVDVDEVHGVIALFELQASRFAARSADDGTPIPLDEQDRALWDITRMQRGFTALLRAEYEAARRQRALGPYALQAAIAACHARAATFAATDWVQVVALYDALVEVTGSPVVALNRAVAVSYADSVHEALVLVDALSDEPALQHYALLPAVRADLLQRLGHVDEAAAAFTTAATLSTNTQECRHFERRAAQCRGMARLGPPA